jgi:ADP-ribosylglycohydrolase
MDLQSDLFGSATSEKLERFKGALGFSAVGDALGWPTEFGWYPKEVEKRFGKKYLEDYVPWEKLVGGKFWGYRTIIKEGEYSDDTQLTLAVYRCIDENGAFKPDRFAYSELPLWLHYERGGGKTIKASARKLTQSSKEWMNNFYTTKDLSYRNAGANGAAMRVLPIALVNINNGERLYRDTFMNSIVTHGHPRAILGSIIYASAARFLVKEVNISAEAFLQYLRETINSFSRSFKGNDVIQKWVQEWNKEPLNGMKFRETFQKTQNEAIEYLKSIKERINSDDEEFYKLTRALSSYKGSGISTVVVAIYLFLKYFDAPQKAILKAVNMLGSDTDSIAAFVGGLFGAYYGLSAIPSNLLDRLQDKEYVLKTATALHDIATGGSIREYVSSKTFERYDAYLKIMAWEVGLREMFWDALKKGDSIVHPALGRGTIKNKRVESLRRDDYEAKLIEIDFDCGQSCVFHSRVSIKNGEPSTSLANETKRTLDLLEKERVVASSFDEIEDIYEIPTVRRKEIERFLAKHKHLFPILKEAEQQIAAIFGENLRLCLELHHDPEEGWDELFIVIKSEYSAEEAIRLQNRLAEEWFLDRMKDTKGKLNIVEEPL